VFIVNNQGSLQPSEVPGQSLQQ